MVQHTVFGVERDLDIPHESFPTAEELRIAEDETLPGCEHGWFSSVVNEAQLHYRKFVPPQSSSSSSSSSSSLRGLVIFMHGISTHSGKALRMPPPPPPASRPLNTALLADALTKQGFALYAFDLYGHGFSEGTRFLIPQSWETNLQDYRRFCHLVASQHDASLPLFLMGESYGCTLTIHLARHFQDHPESAPPNFDSIILTAPAIIGDLPPLPVVWTLRYLLTPLFPTWRPFFMPNPVSADRIWKDETIRKIRMEPRNQLIDGSGIPFRLGTATNLLAALEACRTTAIPGFKLPYCIIHGTEDYGVPMEGSEFMWDHTETAPTDREFHRIDGAYHDLFADPQAEKCMELVLAWIQKRTDSRKKE